VRTGKIILIVSMGLFVGLAAMNNILMPQGGFGAVQGAVGMAITFQPPEAMWRAISSPALIWVLFSAIVIAELIAAFFCFWGARRLWQARESAEAFNAAKSTAIIGLSIIAGFYFFASHAIAQEWFLMWQSQQLNVLPDAFRNFAGAILIMLWLNTTDR